MKRLLFTSFILTIFLSHIAFCDMGDDLVANRVGVDLLWYEISPYNSRAYVKTHQELMAELGSKWLRVDIRWSVVQPRRGVFNWNILDEFFKQTLEFNYLFTVYCDAPWAMIDRSGSSSSFPRDVNDYITFLKALVSRYGDRVRLWQIENEVELEGFWSGDMNEYFMLLQAAHKVIKGVNSKLYVVAPGITGDLDLRTHSGESERWIDALLVRGRGFCDIFDIHLYREYRTYSERLQYVRGKMQEYELILPIIVSELGGPDMRSDLPEEAWASIFRKKNELQRTTDLDDAAAYNKARVEFKTYQMDTYRNNPSTSIYFDASRRSEFEKLQAEDIIKRYVLVFANGGEIAFYHKLRHAKPEEQWSEFGYMRLVDDEVGDDKMLGFYALKKMTEKIGSFKEVRTRNVGNGNMIFQFINSNNEVIICWNENGSEVTVPWEKTHVTVTDIFGNTEPVVIQDGKITLDLSSTPIYVE